MSTLLLMSLASAADPEEAPSMSAERPPAWQRARRTAHVVSLSGSTLFGAGLVTVVIDEITYANLIGEHRDDWPTVPGLDRRVYAHTETFQTLELALFGSALALSLVGGPWEAELLHHHTGKGSPWIWKGGLAALGVGVGLAAISLANIGKHPDCGEYCDADYGPSAGTVAAGYAGVVLTAAGVATIVVVQPVATALGVRRASALHLAITPGWVGLASVW